MKFFAPTNEPLFLALTSGHTAVVTIEGTELPLMFHRLALANGAHTGDESFQSQASQQLLGRTLNIEQALEEAAIANTAGILNKMREPVLHKLIAHLGFEVNKQEVAAAWKKVQEARENA